MLIILSSASCRNNAPSPEPPPSPAPEIFEVKQRRLALGTFVEITALGEDREKVETAVEAAFAEVDRIEKLMSKYREGSDIFRINASAGGEMVAVDPEVFTLIDEAMQISELTDGAFDITVGGLSGLWSFDPEHPRKPSPEEIQARLLLIGYREIELEQSGNRVRLKKPGIKIDLGGVAKGYAVDRALAALKERGVTMTMVNAGGDLRVMGAHHDRPWQVGIQDPRDLDRLIAWLPITNKAVATSGDYEKFVVIDGKRYCHLIDPRTGEPAVSCQSVTVIAPEAWLADALATAVFVLGPERGMMVVEGLPGVEAVIIDAEGGRRVSSGAGALVNWEESLIPK